MSGIACGIDFDVEHALGDDSPLASAGDARILDGVLQIEKDARSRPGSRSSTRTVPRRRRSRCRSSVRSIVASSRGWPGTDKGGQWLPLGCDQSLLKRDALIARQYRLTDPDQPIAVSHEGRDVGDLVAPRLTLLRSAAEPLERFEKEGFDVVGLEPTRFRAFHFLANAIDPACIHRIVGQRPLFDQVLQLAPVECIGHHLVSRARTSGCSP